MIMEKEKRKNLASILFKEKQMTEGLKNIKDMYDYSFTPFCLLVLKDGRFAVSGQSGIRIYDSRTYEYKEITDQSECVNFICQVEEDERLISCSEERTIRFWEKKNEIFECAKIINEAHSERIIKVIALPGNKILSCGEKKEILIWSSVFPYDKVRTLLKAKFKISNHINNIFFFKGKYECLITSHKRQICFFSIKTYQCETVLTDRKCCGVNSMYQLDEEKIIFGDIGEIEIINMRNKTLVDTIIDMNILFINCFCGCNDENEILIGCDDSNLLKLNIKTKQILYLKNSHHANIIALSILNNKILISASNDRSIKLWSLN